MHQVARRFYAHNCIECTTKDAICSIFFLHTYTRDLTEDYDLMGPISHVPCKAKATILKGIIFSDHTLITVVYSKYQRINIGI